MWAGKSREEFVEAMGLGSASARQLFYSLRKIIELGYVKPPPPKPKEEVIRPEIAELLERVKKKRLEMT